MAGKNESLEAFLRFVNERFADFRKSLNVVLADLSREARDKKVEACSKAIKHAENLKEALAGGDRPAWLESVIQAMRDYTGSPKRPDAAPKLLNFLVQNHQAIVDHQWRFTAGSPSIDFDVVYSEWPAPRNLIHSQ